MTDPLNLVLIHGWSCRASDWQYTQNHLRQFKPDLKTLSLALPEHPEYQGEYQATQIKELAGWVIAQTQDITGDWIFCGHSMGGCVALEAASQVSHTGRLDSVILVDTFGLPYGDMDQATIDSIEKPFCDDFITAMNYLVDNTTATSIQPATRNWIKERMSSSNPEKMLPIWHDLLRWSPDKSFQNIQCPIYALNGEHISEAAQIRCAPYVKSKVLEGCHHFPQFERPDDFIEALCQLLP